MKREGKGTLISNYKRESLQNLPQEALSVLLTKAVDIALVNNPALPIEDGEAKIIIKSTSGQKQLP